ncbi:MAG: N-acetylmuramoyl-L-alanine amidase [Bacilli bacterium]|nr:N-acetylmuramoyl-L-alanine amidase [Bacilli bacterium]MDD4076473.1 N-acetylmuramoyl-L-alanine amidase [Bacilli bacterium]MDD4387809.1 N-acetylmuramoyl-L-alanine amidase [Bacilli bacterium]
MDKRKILLILLVSVLAIFFLNIIKVKIKPGIEAVKTTAISTGEENWSDIETFIDLIAHEEIDRTDFYLYGAEKGFEKIAVSSNGYLPFYQQEPLNIINGIVPKSNTDIRPGRNRTTTKYIVIHNTGLASPAATAALLNRSINNSTREASWHFTVDDKEIYQQLYIDEVGWHAGDKEGNEYGIGIEICTYQGIDFNTALRKAAKLTAKLLIDYGLGFNAIKQHYDFSGKNCPQVIRESGRWEEFIELVKIEYLGQTKFYNIDFKWISKSPRQLDHYGRIINNAEKVYYQAVVIYKGEMRIFDLNSRLKQ